MDTAFVRVKAAYVTRMDGNGRKGANWQMSIEKANLGFQLQTITKYRATFSIVDLRRSTKHISYIYSCNAAGQCQLRVVVLVVVLVGKSSEKC